MKEGTYMSELNYITELLELKDNNIKFYENCYHKEKIKGVYHKVFEGVLSYKPICCKNAELFLMIILKNMVLLLLILKFLMSLVLKLFLD